MSRYVLGISALYHDAAAALVWDGEVVAAASEERFSRLKHDPSLPVRAASWCLDHAGISMDDVAHVVFYEKPLRKFERLLVSQLCEFPRSFKAFKRGALVWLTDKLWVRNSLVSRLGADPKRILFCDHHLSHAASAFYGSPFDRAAILTVDGVGEWATTSLYHGTGDGIRPLAEVRFPHSLGLVYSAFTAYLGFQVNDGEYKVMGMSAFGEPRFEEEVRKILKAHSDGGFEVDTSYLAYHHSATESYNARFERLFGPPRFPGSDFDPKSEEGRRFADVAASIQKVTEDVLVGLANAVHARTGEAALCMAGGVALNGVANRAVLTRTPFRRMSVHPAAGDAGGAVGAALWAWNEVMQEPRGGAINCPALGRSWSDAELAVLLKDLGVKGEDVGTERLAVRAAEDLSEGRIVGWFQGGFEWGPRALGYRSILADPRDPRTRDRINARVKYREPFRPFAPSVRADAAHRYFDLPEGSEELSAWMLMVSDVRASHARSLAATTHVDSSARVHTVTDASNPVFHELLGEMGSATGAPVLLNTSFNLKGEPIVASPIDALATHRSCDLDVLYLGPFRIADRTQ